MASLQKRSSNFELLRILAMLMIIAFHILHYCIDFQLTDPDSIEAMGNGFFSNPVFYRRLLLLSAISPVGKVGNAIFLLISGYFMINRGTQINLIRITKKLLLQLGYAVLALILISGVVYRIIGGNVNGISLYLVDASMFNKSDWFVGYYLGVIVIAALFLNGWLNRVDRKYYLTFLLVLFSLVEYAWIGEMMESLATGLRILATGVFLYALGGYIALYHPFEKIRGWVFALVLVAAVLLILQSAYHITIRNIAAYTQTLLEEESEDPDPFVQEIQVFKDYSLLPLLIGVSLFELFRRIRIPSSRVINFMGAATFMIYLLHDNNFVRSLWKMQDWITPLYRQPGQFLRMYLQWIFGIFLFGLLLYALYLSLGRLLPHLRGLAVRKQQTLPDSGRQK